MFEQKYQPEEIADQFHAIVRDGATIFGTYERSVRPNDAERTRLLFTAQLFPVAASFIRLSSIKNSKLKNAMLQAYDIYLARFPDQDQIVKVGDYAIWRVERERVARALREDYCQLVVATDFDNQEIRYAMLLRIVSDIRKLMFVSDMETGMSSANDPKQCLSFAFISAGITFTRQVLKIDPNDPMLTANQQDRIQISSGLASTYIGQSFFRMTDLFKEMGD